MKVLFDHQIFKYKFSGIARYHYELAKGLKKEGHNSKISTIFSACEYLLKDSSYKVYNPSGDDNFKGKRYVEILLNEINQMYSLQSIKMNSFEIFHPTYYDPYFINILKKPLIITIHDCIHEKFYPKESSKDIANTKKLIERANLIIAVSENTKIDVINYHNVPSEKIHVIHHGFKSSNEINSTNLYGDYLLFVGRRDRYKNFERFIKALAPILLKHKSLKLVCTARNFTDEETELLKHLRITDKVTSVIASDIELNSLYKYAKLFVFPSIYEGFGMPILEAFANDCPICISDTSCFPEIAKDAAEYFDPYSIDSINTAIDNVINNENLRQDLIKKGRKRLLEFSWEKTVLETIEVYKQLV